MKDNVGLEQRTDKFTIVLNDNELNLFKSTRNIFTKFLTDMDLSPVYLACIKHDRDKDEHGDLKTQHYHVVIHTSCTCRLRTMIDKIVNLFNCNANQVSIDKCNSICRQSRYLLHLDDIDKEDYFITEVECNDFDSFNRYYNMVLVRDLHDLVNVVKKYHYDLEEIMSNIDNYDKWRKYIADLINNQRRRY